MELFDGVVIVLAFALIISSLLSYLNIPSIVGYLILGVLAGPYCLALIPESHITQDIAEVGVVFLLFTIGLELSVDKLKQLKYRIIVYGSTQIILSILLTYLVGLIISLSSEEALAIGVVICMSSTAIVTKLLKEQNDIQTPHGLTALGILLCQDLAVIPLLILIPSLSVAANDEVSSLLMAILKGGFAIGLIIILGRIGLRPLFYLIAKKRSFELFTLAILLIVLSAARLSQSLGLSLALGAFLAGIMLAETQYRHQIAVDIRPFKDVLLGFFFISVGMQVNIHIVLLAWPWVCLTLLALIVMKFILISGLCVLFSKKWVASLKVGLILAHGGEFSFALLSQIIKYQVLPNDYAQVVLSAVFISMVLAPLFISQIRHIDGFFSGETTNDLPTLDEPINKKNHIIICGYGRVGQNIARLVEKYKIPFIALDLNATQVKTACLSGDPVYYADASQSAILQAAGVEKAKAVLLTFHHDELSVAIAQQIKTLNSKIPIIARCFAEKDIEPLLNAGVNEVVPEYLETSLMLCFHLLLQLKFSMQEALALIENAHKNHYAIFNYVFTADSHSLGKENDKAILAVVLAPKEAVGLNIEALEEKWQPIKIIRVQRNNQRIKNKNALLQTQDRLTIYGPQSLVASLQDAL